MQLREPTQDVGRNVFVASVARGPVPALRDPNVAGPVEQSLEPDPGLGAGQRCTGAAVDSAPEREVLARVLAFGVERVRILETARVTIGGTVDHHQRAAGADSLLADGG